MKNVDDCYCGLVEVPFAVELLESIVYWHFNCLSQFYVKKVYLFNILKSCLSCYDMIKKEFCKSK